MTGIPCGNPRRYMSRAVIRMTRDDKIPYEDQQVGIPGTGTETEAEKEFKKLLDQQMNISDKYTPHSFFKKNNNNKKYIKIK
jgi:hypothetical protein